MKLSSTSLAFAFLLLTGSLVGATTAAAPSSEAGSGSPSRMTPVAPDCSGTALPFVNPEPSEAAGMACGSCSVAACQGMFVGDICAVLPGGRYYICGVVNTCAAMGGGTGKYCDCPGNY